MFSPFVTSSLTVVYLSLDSFTMLFLKNNPLIRKSKPGPAARLTPSLAETSYPDRHVRPYRFFLYSVVDFILHHRLFKASKSS